MSAIVLFKDQPSPQGVGGFLERFGSLERMEMDKLALEVCIACIPANPGPRMWLAMVMNGMVLTARGPELPGGVSDFLKGTKTDTKTGRGTLQKGEARLKTPSQRSGFF